METFLEPLVNLWTEAQIGAAEHTFISYKQEVLCNLAHMSPQLSPHSLQNQEKKIKEPDECSSSSYKFLNTISPFNKHVNTEAFSDYVRYVYLKFLNL